MTAADLRQIVVRDLTTRQSCRDEWIECFLLLVLKTNFPANYIHSTGIYLLAAFPFMNRTGAIRFRMAPQPAGTIAATTPNCPRYQPVIILTLWLAAIPDRLPGRACCPCTCATPPGLNCDWRHGKRGLSMGRRKIAVVRCWRYSISEPSCHPRPRPKFCHRRSTIR